MSRWLGPQIGIKVDRRNLNYALLPRRILSRHLKLSRTRIYISTKNGRARSEQESQFGSRRKIADWLRECRDNSQIALRIFLSELVEIFVERQLQLRRRSSANVLYFKIDEICPGSYFCSDLNVWTHCGVLLHLDCRHHCLVGLQYLSGNPRIPPCNGHQSQSQPIRRTHF